MNGRYHVGEQVGFVDGSGTDQEVLRWNWNITGDTFSSRQEWILEVGSKAHPSPAN